MARVLVRDCGYCAQKNSATASLMIWDIFIQKLWITHREFLQISAHDTSAKRLLSSKDLKVRQVVI